MIHGYNNHHFLDFGEYAGGASSFLGFDLSSRTGISFQIRHGPGLMLFSQSPTCVIRAIFRGFPQTRHYREHQQTSVPSTLDPHLDRSSTLFDEPQQILPPTMNKSQRTGRTTSDKTEGLPDIAKPSKLDVVYELNPPCRWERRSRHCAPESEECSCLCAAELIRLSALDLAPSHPTRLA